MTRDEAKKRLSAVGSAPGDYKPFDETMIDVLSALGILKLDEPTFSPVEKLYYAMNNSYHCGLATFRATLEENGLRIVEK